MENDLISRHGVSAWLANMGYSKLADVVMDEDRFPSAHEKRTEERTEKHACDLISRASAIAAFDGVKVDEENCTEYDIGYNDGIDYAVSSLSVLPSAPSSSCDHENDTISRRMAIDAIFGRSHEIIKMRIGNLPSAQPERKRGKWINGTCNQCGSHAPYWAMATTYYGSNFCPNCGADMRGGENG